MQRDAQADILATVAAKAITAVTTTGRPIHGHQGVQVVVTAAAVAKGVLIP